MLTSKEIKRQLMHIAVGLVTVFLIYIEILSPLAIFLMLVIGIITSSICKRTRLPFFSYFLDKFERDSVRTSFPGKGMIFFFIGVLLVVQLFENDIALAAIMVLTFGDSVSHLFGAKFGTVKTFFNKDGKKLLEGTVVGAVAGFFGAVMFVPITEAFFGSVAAMLVEVVKIDFNDSTLDDNMIVPLVAGTVMLLVRSYFFV